MNNCKKQKNKNSYVIVIQINNKFYKLLEYNCYTSGGRVVAGSNPVIPTTNEWGIASLAIPHSFYHE